MIFSYQHSITLDRFPCLRRYIFLQFVSQEVKDTLDKEALYRCMTQCYEMHQSEKPKLEDIVKSEAGYMQSAKSIASLGGSLMKGVVVSYSKCLEN